MGIWNFFFPRPKFKASDLFTLVGTGDYAIPIVGESHYQANLEAICGPRSEDGEKRFVEAHLIYENNNRHDKNAIRVEIEGKHVGYLSREMAVQYRQQLQHDHDGATGVCSAVIRGGWERKKRGKIDKGDYGVWLDIPEEEAVGKPVAQAKKGKWRTGCLGLVGIFGLCAVVSQFSPTDQASVQAPDNQIVQALAPAVNTPEPTATAEPLPTDTPSQVEPPTVEPTNTAEPSPTNTPEPLPTEPPAPTDTPLPLPTEPPAVVENSGGGDQPFVCNGGCTEPPAGSNCAIKGNVNSKGDKIYHVPGWRDYERTDVKLEEGDRWFCTEDEAVAAGFRAPRNQ